MPWLSAAQTTRPVPVAVWFQPQRNIAMLRAMGVDTFIGPECENERALTPAQLAAARAAWIKAVGDLGGRAILKNPPAELPGHCVGVMLTDAEANRNNTGPTANMRAESIAYRQRYPGIPIYVDLAGDKISSANFDRAWEKQVYLDYAAIGDVLIINNYPANRNASRYKTTWPAEVVAKLAAATGKPVWPAIEMNDQYVLPLPKPADGISRSPTPDEIRAQVDACLAAGAPGIVWFATSQSNKYGWGVKDPAKGDSYWPLVDRDGASIRPQLDMVAAIGRELTGAAPSTRPAPPAPATLPTDAAGNLATEVRELRAALNEQTGRVDYLGMQQQRTNLILERIFNIPANVPPVPATQPAR